MIGVDTNVLARYYTADSFVGPGDWVYCHR